MPASYPDAVALSSGEDASSSRKVQASNLQLASGSHWSVDCLSLELFADANLAIYPVQPVWGSSGSPQSHGLAARASAAIHRPDLAAEEGGAGRALKVSSKCYFVHVRVGALPHKSKSHAAALGIRLHTSLFLLKPSTFAYKGTVRLKLLPKMQPLIGKCVPCPLPLVTISSEVFADASCISFDSLACSEAQLHFALISLAGVCGHHCTEPTPRSVVGSSMRTDTNTAL